MTASNIPKLVRKQKTIILYMEFHISQANMSRLARDEKWLWARDGAEEKELL